MIVKINYETILEVWTNFLWPNRQSKIETHSAMLLDRTYNCDNFNYPASYFALMIDNKIAGVNSGHMCVDNTFRSRGLYVFDQYRGQGIGSKLLTETIAQGSIERAKLVWSYPRESSWITYNRAGFKLISEWEGSELGTNAYCAIDLS